MYLVKVRGWVRWGGRVGKASKELLQLLHLGGKCSIVAGQLVIAVLQSLLGLLLIL